MTSDCSVLGQATGKTTQIITIYPKPGEASAGGVTAAVTACLSEEGSLELINCEDGVVENVIEPSVSRDIFLLKLAGDHIPAGAHRRRKKKG